MLLDVHCQTYRIYGGHPTLTAIGNYLSEDAPSFGEGLLALSVTLHFPSSGPPKPTLEGSYERFNQARAMLPRCRFERKRRSFSIDVASELLDGTRWDEQRRVELTMFQRGVGEVIAACELMRMKVKPSDGFDVDAWLSHCAARRTSMPNDDAELTALVARLKKADEERRAQMSPWEKLDIDWSRFHPDARTILDDPFYWSESNDFSPHGNDTGADLLQELRAFRKRSPANKSAAEFIEWLAKQWGYAGASELDDDTRDEAALGLAFGQLKLDGRCEPDAREQASQAVARMRARAVAASAWPHREERLRTLAVLEAKLRAL